MATALYRPHFGSRQATAFHARRGDAPRFGLHATHSSRRSAERRRRPFRTGRFASRQVPCKHRRDGGVHMFRSLVATLALAMLLPVSAAAQDFGVMNSAETINKG